MYQKVSVKGVDINYKVTGAGADVILLHGWGCTLEIFKAIHTQLEKHFRVFALDFPGFGESTEPSEIWGTYDYTDMLEDFIKIQNIKNPILMGHSFGGRVSIIYASKNEVNKVILVDSAGVKPRRSLEYYFKVYSFKTAKKLLPYIIGKDKAQKRIDSYRSKAGSSDYNSASPQMRTIMSKVVNEDLCHLMPKIKSSTLLIWGDLDTATPLADAKIMERKIKGSGLVVFKGAGHYSFLERPYEFSAVIDKFLEKDKTI